MLPWAFTARASTSIPVGLELYSLRETLKKDPEATLRAVAQMGNECVEFYAPNFDWTEGKIKQTRKLSVDVNMRCFSTQNDGSQLSPEHIDRTRDMNLILGSQYVVLASAGQKTSLTEWRSVADMLNIAAEKLEPAGLKAGYHNHQLEFTPVGGQRPIEILAKHTKPSIMLQLDVGTCLEAGSDPVAWVRANPGRIRSIHCKDWSPDAGKGYAVLFGEGTADWKNIFAAAEDAGGVEYYLVEQEGSRFSELETARRCLQAFREKHGG